MADDWQALTRLTGGQAIEIERVRLVDRDIHIEGRFQAPPLAQLAADDQIFVAAFVRCHGSIKQMEKYFGISYPTVKNRLNRIGEQLPFVQITQEGERSRTSTSELLDRLDRGELSASDVVAQLHSPAKGDQR